MFRSETKRSTRSRSSTRSEVRRTGPSNRSSSCQPQSAGKAKFKKQDNRPIHDKAWQRKQLIKIQTYFQNDTESAFLLKKGTIIRPITLIVFIQLTNFVLKKIAVNFEELTLANYIDLLPQHLNIIRYPGTVNASMLKTVNTAHSWSYVLAILSWLVSFEQLGSSLSIQELLNFDDCNIQNDVSVDKLMSKICKESYPLWNSGQDPGDYLKKFEECLTQHFNYSPQIHQKLQSEIEKATRKFKELESKRDKNKLFVEKCLRKFKAAEQRSYTLKADLENKTSEIEQAKERKFIRLANIEKLKKEVEMEQENLEKIKSRIDKQEMNITQRDKLLLKIEEVEKQLCAKKNVIIEQDKVSTEHYYQLKRITKEIEAEINKFNVSLVQPSSIYIELKKFSLPTTQFLHHETSEEITRIINAKKKYLKKLDDNVEDSTSKLKALDEIIKQNQKDIENLKNEVGTKKNKLAKLLEKVKETKFRLENEEKKKLEEISHLKEEIVQVKSTESEIPYAKLEKLKEKEKYLENKFLTRFEEALDFFTKIDDKIAEEIEEVQRLFQDLDNAAQKALNDLDPQIVSS